MEQNDFNIIFNRLKAFDEDAWFSIKAHIGIILSSWAKREKIELDWVATVEGIRDHGSIREGVYSRFRDELLSGMLEADGYEKYKAAILLYAHEILEDQFERFYNLITKKSNGAWEKVNERLYIYAVKWLSDRLLAPEIAREIYQESVLTLIKKVTVKKLSFETSRDFKSYYFRILELKTIEYNRKNKLHSQRSLETEFSQFIRPIEEERYEADDRYYIIEKIMNDSISKDEKYILKHYYFHSEKLSDIAKILQISDGNCRLKKHQALKKIADAYHKYELRARLTSTKKTINR